MAVLEPLLKTVKSKHFVSGEKGMVDPGWIMSSGTKLAITDWTTEGENSKLIHCTNDNLVCE